MIRLLFAAALSLATLTPALAQQGPATTEPQGRYRMSPADGGGFVRLDTINGTMSICQRRDGDWACRDMEDSGAKLRQDNERLEAENRQLKDEIRKLEDIVVGEGTKPRAEGPGFKLPTEEDVDKAMSYVERMLKKFRDKLKELESGKPSTPL